MRVNAIFFDTKAQRREDTKFFNRTKMLINGKYIQPFERIEPIEPFERFLDTKSRSFLIEQRC